LNTKYILNLEESILDSSQLKKNIVISTVFIDNVSNFGIKMR
jgi:hypothetical protein